MEGRASPPDGRARCPSLQKLDIHGRKARRCPFVHRVQLSAVQTLGHCKLGRAVGTNGPGREGINGLPALTTLPVVPKRRGCATTWTSKTFTARHLREF